MNETILNITLCACVMGLICLVITVTFYLYPIFLGLFPFLKARKLTDEDIMVLKEKGICHKTTTEGMKGIQKENTINGSKGVRAYSTLRKKSAFFFANAYIKRGEVFNENLKYRQIVNITNLSDEQIKKMRIRLYDSAIIYLGDFKFEEKNQIEYIDMGRPKYSIGYKIKWIMKEVLKSFIPSKFGGAIVVSVIISLTISVLIIIMIPYWFFA